MNGKQFMTLNIFSRLEKRQENKNSTTKSAHKRLWYKTWYMYTGLLSPRKKENKDSSVLEAGIVPLPQVGISLLPIKFIKSREKGKNIIKVH